MDEALMTRTAFAKRWEVSRPYISKLVRLGKIKTENGKVVVRDGDKFMATRPNHRSDKAAALANGKFSEAQEADRRLRAAKATLAELDLKKKQGVLVERAEVERDAARAANVLKEALSSRNRRLAGRLAGKKAREIMAALEKSDKEVLKAFSEALGEYDGSPG